MKKDQYILLVLLVFVLCVLLAVPVYASDKEALETGLITETPSQQSEEIRPEWGTEDMQAISIPCVAFRPLDSTTTFGIADWTLYRTGGNLWFTAPLYLPTGAQIVFVDLYYYDNSEFNVSYDVLRLDGPSSMPLYHGASDGTPGYDFLRSTNILETIDNNTYTYIVLVTLPAIDFSLGVSKAIVYYRLQISPAPSTATFWDVPVGSFWHQYVEALAASGITTGYGDGTFRPRDFVTRGQMAAFFSRALGLHWPN